MRSAMRWRAFSGILTPPECGSNTQGIGFTFIVDGKGPLPILLFTAHIASLGLGRIKPKPEAARWAQHLLSCTGRHNPRWRLAMANDLIHDRGRGPEIVGTRITVYNLLPHFLDPTATEA